MKRLIVLIILLSLSFSAIADRADGTVEHFPMAGQQVVLKLTGPVVAKLKRNMNRVSVNRQGYQKGQHITCLRNVCVLIIANKTTGTLVNRPDVLFSKFTTKGTAIAYDFVGTRTQGTLSVYGDVAQRLFNEMGQATIEWRMSANGSTQKVGSRFSCERTVASQNRRNVFQFSCSFFIEDKSLGKIGTAPMG